MIQESKKLLFYISFGVILYACLMNLNAVLQFLHNGVGLILPILFGLLFAFVLNVPMRGIEHLLGKLFALMKRQPSERVMQILSLLLTLVCIVLLITVACTMAIPALVTSAKSVYPLVIEKWPEWITLLNSYQIDSSMLTNWAEGFDFNQMSYNASSLLDTAIEAATSTISGIVSAFFGLIIAVYALLSKKMLSSQIKKLLYANLPKGAADYLCYVGILTRDTYSKFLSGQCVEAIVLGSLVFISFHLFQLPYAGLIGFLTGLFSFIPYIGAISCYFVAAFLVLLVAPKKVLLCIAVSMVIQFIENKFIYPHVVGGSVGLAPLWTLIAALIGGKCFGLLGIIFFIPLAAVVYTLMRDNTNRKLQEKNIAF